VKVQFLGSGDAFGSGGRLQSCILVENGERQFLVDCGASAMISLNKYGIDPNKISLIMVSNLHGDHFGGIPYFIIDAQLNQKRKQNITLIGPTGLKKRFDQVMEAAFPGFLKSKLSFELIKVELNPADQFVVSGMSISTFEAVSGESDIHLIYRIESQGKIFAYSGDTDWTDKLVTAAQGADLLVAESYFYAKKVKHHLDYRTLMANYSRLGAKKVIITHMGQEMLEYLHALHCEYAEDGKVFEF